MNGLLDGVVRNVKPRMHGITMVIDTGTPVARIADDLASVASYVDYVKFGWCTSLLTPDLDKKIEALSSLDIKTCTGGTLFEFAYVRGKMDEYTAFINDHDFSYIEVSDGAVSIPRNEKLGWIERLCQSHKVISEYGSKDAIELEAPSRWVKGMREELEAGAWKVVAEGRESGTRGLYRSSSELRTGLVDEIIETIPVEKVIWEAPKKEQQVWFVKKFGEDVNLGNIAIDKVISLETLRLGLRADTLLDFQSQQ